MGKVKRIWHPWGKWECYKAGFYLTTPPTKELTEDDCFDKYVQFFSDLELFEASIKKVFAEWKHSCEHFLTNPNANKIAWIGQASICIAWGIPAGFKGGFKLLPTKQQEAANALAKKYLDEWLENAPKG